MTEYVLIDYRDSSMWGDSSTYVEIVAQGTLAEIETHLRKKHPRDIRKTMRILLEGKECPTLGYSNYVLTEIRRRYLVADYTPGAGNTEKQFDDLFLAQKSFDETFKSDEDFRLNGRSVLYDTVVRVVLDICE